MPQIYRSDLVAVHFTVPLLSIDNEDWDLLEGGDNVAEGLIVHPGGGAAQVALGGIPKRSPLTVARLWSDVLVGKYKQLDALVGYAPASASYAQLGPNYVATGEVITYTGILVSVERPNYKAGTSEEAMLKCVLDLNGEVN